MDHKTACWHEPDKTRPDDERLRALNLVSETATIEQRQSSWHELALWNATLYSNRELAGFRWGQLEADEELWPADLRTENIVEEIGDAMLSKASSSPLKPTPVPHGKSWKVERAVRKFDQFMFGVWQQTNAEDACVQGFLDAFQAGHGCVRVAYSGGSNSVAVESVFFDNVIIDNRECANRAQPRTYRIRQVVPRTSVEGRYKKRIEQIRKKYVDYRAVGKDWVVLVEAWRLPDASGDGGYHMVACEGDILEEREWTHNWVPLVFLHWKDRTSGFFCKSGVEQLVPYYNRLCQLNDDIEAAQDLCCRPRLTAEAHAQFDVSHWDSEQGRILLWSGAKPEQFEWRTNINELYMERDRIKAGAFSHAGLSEMYAHADVPQQVRMDSSAGIREVRNMEDARHLRLWTRFEKFRLDVARAIMNVLSISKGADAFESVYYPGGKASARNIPFEAVRTLTKDQYSWRLAPVPLSVMSPASRRETIRDYASRGLGESEGEVRRMHGNSNLERMEDLELGSIENIYCHIEKMEEGEYEAPTELTNLTYGIRKVTNNLHRLSNLIEPDEDANAELQRIMENHVQWIVTAQSIQEDALARQAAMQAPQQPVPFAPTQGMPGTNATTTPSAPA